MQLFSRALLASLIVLACSAPGASAFNVTVRVAGTSATQALTAVNTTGTAVPGGCAGGTAGEALDLAVGGNWDRQPFTSTILGETHTYAAADYWGFWHNNTWAQVGLCQYVVQPGDKILVMAQRDNGSYEPQIFPLQTTSAPSSVVEGSTVTVTISEYQTSGGPTTQVPSSGATVTIGSKTATTSASGQATLILTEPGTFTIAATKTDRVSADPRSITVTAAPASAPTEGGGGGGVPAPTTTTPTTTASAEAPPTEPAPGPAPTAAPAPDRTAPRVEVSGVQNGETYNREDAPREFSGTAGQPARVGLRALTPDPSGIASVKLRLTRNDRGRCAAYSGSTERFVRRGCGAGKGWWLEVSRQARWSYLLPFRLPRGRYVLDVKAFDRAGNVDETRRPGVNRIVFRVR